MSVLVETIALGKIIPVKNTILATKSKPLQLKHESCG